MKIKDLSLAYENKKVLQDVNFFLGKHLSLLGPNGSGKSTLAKALCGLLPYEGSITLNALELREVPAKQRAKEITYIPSKMESFEQFTTVEDFVLLGRYPYKPSFKDYSREDKNIVQDVLKELSLSPLAKNRLHELSSGQQQLVLIAQALSQKSKILIFDEPTSNLDPKNAALFVKEFKKLRKNHKTILITHDIQLAAFLDDPVVFLQNKTLNFYEKGFFEQDFLSSSYGVKFKDENGLLGIAYE